MRSGAHAEAVAAPRPTIGQECLLAGLGVLALHAILRLWVAPGAYHDDAVYLALGKALATGQGWHSIYAVGAPVHLKYPPALPAIYAVLWWVGGSIERTLGLVHAFHLLVAGVCGALAWWLVRVRLDRSRLAAAFALLPFALISVVDHWQLSISEGPFVAAWLSVLALAMGPLTNRRAVALGLLLAFATLLRSQGWALVGGVVLAQLLDRDCRGRAVLTGVAAILPVVVWSLIVAAMARHGPVSTQPNESGYLGPLAAMPLAALVRAALTTVSINVSEYGRMLPHELGPSVAGYLLAAAFAALIIIGGLRDRRRSAPLSLTLGLSLALLLVLPYNQERYIIALLPVAALLVVHGWPVVARRMSPRVAAGLAIAAVAVVLVRQRAVRLAATSPDPISAVGFEPVGRTLTRNTAWFEAVVPWVASSVPVDARIFTEGAAGLWLATGRTGVAALWPAPIFMPAAEHDPRIVAERIAADSITVVIASSAFVTESVETLGRRCPGAFRRVAVIGGLATAFVVDPHAMACMRAAALAPAPPVGPDAP